MIWILRVVLIIFTVLWFLYYLWNAGLASGIIHQEFGPDTFHEGLAAFVVMLVFAVHLSIVLLTFHCSAVLVFKTALLTITILWTVFCLVATVNIWLNIKRNFVHYVFLTLLITAIIILFVV